ncbi:MAG: hypothetical protein IJX96_04565 [Clostridia bacterium]|nr:hypothetical protein [Clostridia bacterium]
MKKRENNTKTKDNKKESDLVTKESLCAVCALFSLVALLVLCTRSLIFGEIGATVHAFLTGLFGYLAYPVTLGVLYLSVAGLIGKRFVKDRKSGFCIALAVICATLIVHTATTYSWELEGYIAKCFNAGKEFPAATVAGWTGALLVYAVSAATTKLGAIIVFSALAIFFGYLAFLSLKRYFVKGTKTQVSNASDETTAEEPQTGRTPVQAVEIPLSQTTQGQAERETATAYAQNPYGDRFSVNAPQRPAFTLSDETNKGEENKPTHNAFSPFGTAQTMRQSDTDSLASSYQNSREFLFGSTPAENYKRNLIFDPNANVNKRAPAEPTPAPTPVVREGYSSYTDAYQSAVNDDGARPMKIFTDRTEENTQRAYEREPIAPIQPIEDKPLPSPEPVSYPSYTQIEEPIERVEETPAPSRHEYMDLFSPSNPNIFGNSEADRGIAEETFSRRDEPEEIEIVREVDEPRGRGIDIFDEPDEVEESDDPYTLRDETVSRGRDRFIEEDIEAPTVEIEPVRVPEPKPEPTPPPPPKPRVIRPYVRMPIDDFDCRDVEPTSNAEEVEETKANIIATLDDFKVTGASIASVTFGPTVTRYNVTIPRNISPRKVVALDQSIAISLHSSGVNIYPNYEDGVVSIEVPNKDRQFVQLGCMLTGDTYVNARPSSLMFTMGKDVANRKVYGDISKMIHLLVAGSSGSGKSVFLGSLIISLIHKYSPEELRLILIDPKKTEFVLYNNLPHLMINEIITDVNKAVQSLNWAIGKMNRRYGLFEQMSRAGTYVVNLDDYNKHLDKNERLPKIVIIIDELADLMLAAKKDIEDRIQNLTQKARAAGIHLVVATQRPSTDVITGVIKSNLPTRIAFAVATDVDSRVILDQTGAQKLLGKGDFLYTMQGINTPVRVQSAFISAEDSQKVVNFLKANNEAYYDESATAFINNARSGAGGDSMGGGDEVEPVYIEALRYVILSESASISMIQRKCSVGYNKAGKIVEWMEDMGYISSFDGAKARKVLITKEEFESKYGTL